MEETEVVFTLAILAVPDEDGKPIFHLRTKQEKIREELVLEFVRNWLRAKDDNYHSNFRKMYSL